MGTPSNLRKRAIQRPSRISRVFRALCLFAGLAASSSGVGMFLPVVACGLLLVEPCALADVYVNLATGSDLNPGTLASPRLTIPSTAANGSLIYVQGSSATQGVAQTTTFTSKSNITIMQWPGGTQAVLHGGVQIGTGFTNTSGDVWTKTIATGLTISRVAYKYDASVTSTGQHYGIMRPVAVPANAGEYLYSSVTGLLTIVVPSGGSPNGAAADVIYAAVNAVPATIYFVGGSGNSVIGLEFRFSPSAEDTQFGWHVRFSGSTNGVVMGCTSHDPGYHAVGCIGGNGDSSGLQIIGCTFYAGGYSATQVVFNQLNSEGSLTGCELSNSVVHMRQYLGVDGTNATESSAVTQGQSANAQVGLYAHADTGTPIAGVLGDGCTFIEYGPTSAGPQPWACGNVTANAGSWDQKSFAFRLVRCTLRGGSQTGATRILSASPISLDRCILDFRNAGPSGLAGVLGTYFHNGGGGLTMVSCSIIMDLNQAATETFGLWSNGASDDIRMDNCSVHIVNAAALSTARNFMVWGTDTSFFRARGTVFSMDAATASVALCRNDGGANAAHHEFLDCAYYGITTYSANGSFDTQAEWLALVDTAGQFLASSPFLDSPTNLTLKPASSLWSLRRTTAVVIPSNGGINGPYAAFFGAYQYGITSWRDSDLGPTSTSRFARSRVWR